MRVNRCFMVVVSQDDHQGHPDWTPIWGGAGGVRVYALDRERCLLPVDFGEFDNLVRSVLPPTPEDWNRVPPTLEPVADERRSSRNSPSP